jgi:ribosome-binding factor A
MANKHKRIESLILRNLSEIIAYQMKDPHLGWVNINDVTVTNDYSYAKVYVTFIGDGDKNAKLEILNKAKGFLRFELAKTLDIRKTPELIFIYDDTLERAARIDEILKKDKK